MGQGVPDHGFGPVSRPDARVLVLGSMPGRASLAAHQYYAFPRNAFWPLMGEFFGAGPSLPYAERLGRLLDAGVALWDVLASCRRPGSLDAAIVAESARPNDFGAFFAVHARLRAVFFNGQAAARWFERAVAPGLAHAPPTRTLPSTSPANASWSYERKREAWRAVAAAARGEGGGHA